MDETQTSILCFLCFVVSAQVLKKSREKQSRDALLRGELRRAYNHVQKQMKHQNCSNTSLELVALIEKVPTHLYSLYNE